MKKAKKEKVFRIVYEIEYEYFQEQSGQSEQIITVKKKSETLNINANTAFADRISRAVEYIDKHLPAEIEDTIRGLYGERNFSQWGDREQNKETRDLIINTFGNEDKKKRRKRLYVDLGAEPKKNKSDFIQKKEQFISKCIKHLKILKSENNDSPINKTDLAERMFDTYIDRKKKEQYYSNPLRELGKKLKLYEISFEDLILKYTNKFD